MSRVSFFSKFETSKRMLLENARQLDETRRDIASGKKLRKPSDNPTDTVRLLRFQNQQDNIERFKDNITQGRNSLENSNSVLKQANSVLQRARELAVRGANDSLDTSARSNIADEINQRLEELVDLANSKVGDKFLFGGSETTGETGSLFDVRRNGQNEIVEVRYNGDANNSEVEVSGGQLVKTNLPGHKVFQATNQTVTGGETFADKNSVTNESLDQNGAIDSTQGKFQLDDTTIFYDTAEDSLTDIAQRINDKGVGVKAVIEGASGTEYEPNAGDIAAGDAGYQLKFKSRTPHKIYMKDIDRDPTGTPNQVEGLLNDLQFLGDGSGRPPEPRSEQDFPNPYHQNSEIGGKSMFDALIDAREALQPNSDPDPAANFQVTLQNGNLAQLTDRPQDLPGQEGSEQAIEDLQNAINNLNVNRSIGGARINRVESSKSRLLDLEVSTTELVSELQDTDLAEATTRFSRQRTVQQASLRMATQVSNLTLANFI
jgi:flagellar hook-associated protein 3 FlgL